MNPLDTFLDPFQSVVIGSLDEDGSPFCSYAPFIRDGSRYYVFISDVARHSANLRRTPRASLLFIEDEAATANLFARKRVVMQCGVEVIARDAESFTPVMERFKTAFGEEMMGMLMSMKDFNLYAFRVTAGEATFGFGEAYTLGGESMQELLPRRGGGGHKRE